jgi:hypothetical protein
MEINLIKSRKLYIIKEEGNYFNSYKKLNDNTIFSIFFKIFFYWIFIYRLNVIKRRIINLLLIIFNKYRIKFMH